MCLFFTTFDTMDILVGLQVPYAMMIGWEVFLEKEDIGYKSLSVYLLFCFIELRWSFDE
jgi:hypothetical protein